MTSLLFAVIGTIIQAFVTGLLIYAVGLIPFVNYDLPILDWYHHLPPPPPPPLTRLLLFLS